MSTALSNRARQQYNQYIERQAQLHGTDIATITRGVKYAIDPSVEQKLESAVQESSAFLQKINIVPVSEQEGESLGLGWGSTVASRTDTDIKDRQTQDQSGLTSDKYRCIQTNFDTHIKYQKLDMWAKFPDFQKRIGEQIVKRIGLDRIMIGWNGLSVASDTNQTTNPLLEDVNIGWLAKYRQNAAQRVLNEGQIAGSKVRVGTGGDYATLDAMVFDLIANMLDPWHRKTPDLVVIMGSNLYQAENFKKINVRYLPNDELALNTLMQTGVINGKPVVDVPFIPDGTLMITTLENLSIYWQLETRRRAIVENPKRDRIETYESVNEAYVIEDYGLGCVAENIEII